MSELHKHKINLSERQKNKLRIAFKKQKSAIIGLTNDQLKGEDFILLTDEQHKNILRAQKNNKGLRLTITYEQLQKSKDGGLLKEILSFVEDKLPFGLGKNIVTPLVKKKVAPLLKNKFIPWLKELIDGELDEVIEGSGLKKQINQKLDSILSEAIQKK